jgi:fructan beta-fructosidase
MTHPLRPLYHFTPPAGWLNDPNGMVYAAGEYHLFYQHHPTSLVWDAMHWGHAVSRDLVRWEHLPIALAPDSLGTIFSGSAVVDARDTAGFGAGALVAAFTYDGDHRQTQGLAFSTDHGRSWTKYAGNPVLRPEDGRANFRDPKVFWYSQGSSAGHWVMALSAGDSIWLYSSPDLKSWTRTSIFGLGYGSHAGVWETPDLFELAVDGGPETKWVLSVGVMHGAPAGGSGVQYFVGDFDGATFTSDHPPEHVLWADFGADFYAPQSWSDAPDGRRTWLAWMNNWRYAREVPASTWRGSMTVPRDLALTRTSEGVRLIQHPAPELARLRRTQHSWGGQVIPAGQLLLEGVRGDALEIVAAFGAAQSAERFGVQVRVGGGEATEVGYDVRRGELYIDRSRAGQAAPGFDLPQIAPLALADRPLTLRIFADRASVEVFADDGHVALTSQIFPSAGSDGIALFSVGGPARLSALEVYELAGDA